MSALISGFSHILETPLTLHPLHGSERPWPQTNCSVDLLIELVAAYRFDPIWMLAFTLTQDFEGDHFTFFKVPNQDLEALYGLVIQELAVWDELEGHILEQLQRSRVVLLEVDGYFLPDTRGVTYRERHGKTTIGIFSLDRPSRRMGYFHNETRGVLEGEDYDGVLQKLPSQSALLMPYCEVLKCAAAPSKDPGAQAVDQLCGHWMRRPPTNPFRAYAEVFPAHLERLKAREPAYFHGYAFNTLRQFGANYGLMESFLLALPAHGFVAAAACARALADDAKALQFRLARAVTRNKFDGFGNAIESLAETYDQLMQHLGSTELLAQLRPS